MDFITEFQKKSETGNIVYLTCSKRGHNSQNCKGKAKYNKNTGKVEIYEQCKKENTNLNTPLASYKAGYIIYTKYENPIDKEKLAKIRARTANNIYHIMKS